MNAYKVVGFGALVLSVGLVVAGSAYAQSTGWLDANQLQDFGKKHFSKQILPTAISCKDAEAVAGMDRRNTMLKIEYGPNPNHVRWEWAWGSLVGKIDHDNIAKGYKISSQDSFRRPSGLLMRCAIWHK
jgi:hypothetical protein